MLSTASDDERYEFEGERMLANENRLFTAQRIEGDDVESQWLELRRTGIGGSDVAAIMGISPWTSPIEVWMDKTGRAAHKDISGKEAVQMGVELEDDVADMYRRRHPGTTVFRSNAVLRSVRRPWAQASLDRVVRSKDDGWGVLEIKTGSKSDEWKDGVPLHYQTQVLHYLSVTGYQYADVAALIGDHGLHYYEYRIVPDYEDMFAVTDAVDTFWHECVESDAMPAVITPLQSESRAIYEMYKRSDGEMDEPDSERFEELAKELAELNESASHISELKSKVSNELKRLVGEHKGIIGRDRVVTWVRSEKCDRGIRVKDRK